MQLVLFGFQKQKFDHLISFTPFENQSKTQNILYKTKAQAKKPTR
jgi:hypothetical protein